MSLFSEKDAQNAYSALNGRYYAGKVVSCFFTHVKNWREAICGKILVILFRKIVSISYCYFHLNKKGSFLRKKCTKSRNCNYLHVFKNPYNEYKHFPSTIFVKHPEKSSLKRADRKGTDNSNAWSSEDEYDENRVTQKWEADDDREKRTWYNGESKSDPVRNGRCTSRDSRSKKHREINSHHTRKREKQRHEDRNRSDYSKEHRNSKDSSHKY